MHYFGAPRTTMRVAVEHSSIVISKIFDANKLAKLRTSSNLLQTIFLDKKPCT